MMHILCPVSWSFLFSFQKPNEPIHILNIAIQSQTQDSDENHAAIFGDFCLENVSISKYI